MAFRIIMIESDVFIQVKLNNLIITKDGEDIWVPLDDIATIVIDNLASSITLRIMSQLADKGIGLVVCDQKHLPIGYYGGIYI